MKSRLKKVLFSLGAIGLVTTGTLGMVNAQFTNQEMDYNPGDHTTLKEDTIINTAKSFINWVLGLLSLIALAICLRGGFQMLTASGDETKYKKGFTILKQAGLGLVIIGLAWLLVSLIFRIVNKFSDGTGNGTQATAG